ncbi:MAG: curlin [Alphaproteobacteria bacterium]|nr:curlin [Alphaproteobacteria bacterium]
MVQIERGIRSLRFASWVIGLLGSAMLASCASPTAFSGPPSVAEGTGIHAELIGLPPPTSKIAVAVYRYDDRTGQFEFSDTVQTLSRAVTQGASAILIKALQDAGAGVWFTVVEREGLNNLLRERQIIRETRALYEGGNGGKPSLPPLLFAGMIIEGGIIDFDTNTATGGAGARVLGIGGAIEYRMDTVVVYLRTISTNTGEVLMSVNVSKTIFSYALDANVFRFIASDEILEVDAGITRNEPEHVALKQAIEKGVMALVFEGVQRGYWAFAEETTDVANLMDRYFQEKLEPAGLIRRPDRPTDSGRSGTGAAEYGLAGANR